MNPKRHLSASMVVVDPASHMVLLAFSPASGLWQFPGGHIEAGEDPCATAVREVIAQTGVYPTVQAQPADFKFPGMHQLGNPWMTCEIDAPAQPWRPEKAAEPAHRHIDMVFIGTADSTAALRQRYDDGEQAARWVAVSELSSTPDVRADVADVTLAALAVMGVTVFTADAGRAAQLQNAFINAMLDAAHYWATSEPPADVPMESFAKRVDGFVWTLLTLIEGAAGINRHRLASKREPAVDLSKAGLPGLWSGHGVLERCPDPVREFIEMLREETTAVLRYEASIGGIVAANFALATELAKVFEDYYVLEPLIDGPDGADDVPSGINICPGLGAAVELEAARRHNLPAW